MELTQQKTKKQKNKKQKCRERIWRKENGGEGTGKLNIRLKKT